MVKTPHKCRAPKAASSSMAKLQRKGNVDVHPSIARSRARSGDWGRRYWNFGGLSSGAHGLEGHRAARARSIDLGYDLARCGLDGHLRVHFRDLDRAAQVHA